MYITFIKHINQIETTERETNRTQSLEEFLLGIEPSATEIVQEIVGTENKRITAIKTKEELKPFFRKHYKDNWTYIPTPPSWPISEMHQHYNSFKIPKKSGGLRDIDAPDDELKDYLSQLKNYFEHTLSILTHDCAHAYVKERSTITDLKVHQANNSNWFLKLDLKEFFPSHDLAYTLKVLKDIYPIGLLMEDPCYETKLIRALEYAFLDGKLPQGTPLSPTLTNILMVPIDYQIQHELWNQKSHFIYTRYADDMTISSPYKFDWKKVENSVKQILDTSDTPFKVNAEKTRFGSKNGRNWNLGIMLNKDNRITIGHKQNQRFRASVFNIMQDYTHNIKWSPEDKQVLAGQIAYYKAVDPEYTQIVIERYENKFGVKLKSILKN